MSDYTFGIGEELQFNGEDDSLSHLWDFGDGETSTLPSPVHTYSTFGIYSVSHVAVNFCGACDPAITHTVKVVPASIIVKNVLLDTYVAKAGDYLNITTLVENVGDAYGKGSIVLKYDDELIATYEATLYPAEQVSFTHQHLITKSGTVNLCADSLCVVLFVASSITVNSVLLSSSETSGQPIQATITVQNNSNSYAEQKNIKTTLSNLEVSVLDERIVTLDPFQTTSYDVPVDVKDLAKGIYTVCADGVCRSFNLIAGLDIGAIKFISIPEGAEIYIDGADQGVKTPATLINLPAGEHTFTLKLEGYNDTVGTVQISGGMITYVYATLIPLSPTTGAIDVSSTPAGAELFIDGTDQNVKTPTNITDLPEGSYTIKLTLTGYQEWAGTVNIKAGQTAYLSAGLISPAPPPSQAGKYLAAGGLLLIPLGLVLTRKKEKTQEELAAEARRAAAAYREIRATTVPIAARVPV